MPRTEEAPARERSPLGTPDARITRRHRILIVDDHPVFRRGLRELIVGESDLEVCGDAGNADEALQRAAQLAPDLMIVDLSLRESSGLDLVKRLRVLHPEIAILVASMHDESLMAERSLRAGALGFVSKHEPVERTLDAIRTVLAHGVYLSPELSARTLQTPREPVREGANSTVARLSNRELEVFEALGHGRGTRAIAESLHLSVKTVETHRDNIKRKLGLNSGRELLQRAWQWILNGD